MCARHRIVFTGNWTSTWSTWGSTAPTSRAASRNHAQLAAKRGCCPLSRCCRCYASLHVFFHCPVQACVKTAQTLGWKARDGSDPFVGMRLCATHRLVLLQTFSKDIFRCRDRSPCVFFAFVCGILSSGRGSRGRLARFLDVCPSVCVSSVSGKGNDFEDLLLAVVRTGQGFGCGHRVHFCVLASRSCT